MATLWVSEYEGTGEDSLARSNYAPKEPRSANQTVTISGASTQSSAFDSRTRLIRVKTDTACYVEIGANPTASTSSLRLDAGDTEYFSVVGGHKIAVIS